MGRTDGNVRRGFRTIGREAGGGVFIEDVQLAVIDGIQKSIPSDFRGNAGS